MPPARKPRGAKAPKAPGPTDSIVQSILKDFGDVVISGDDLIRRKKAKIPMSPAFDFAHNGGLQEGTFVILVGPPRCGKTTSALHFAGKSQRSDHGSRKVVYLNAEHRLEERDLEGIASIRTDPAHFIIIQSSPPERDKQGNVTKPGRILTARDFLTIAERFLINTTRHVVILDSISVMLGESEWEQGLDSNAIGEAQRLFSKFMRRMSQTIAVNQHIFIGIVHLYSNVGGGMGPKWLEKMSSSAQYGLASKFRAIKFAPWQVGTEAKTVGQTTLWKCERSPLGPPNIQFTSYLRYGHGIDELMEVIHFAVAMKLIEKDKKGSWYHMQFLGGDPPPKVNGQEAVRMYLLEHPEAFDVLRSEVSEALGI